MAHDHDRTPGTPLETSAAPGRANGAHTGSDHSIWWMVACCAPMVVLVLLLLFGFLGTR